MFVIKAQSKLPIFEQLKAQILEFISLGIFNANDKLPSVRSLAMDLGINPNTVAKAYQELELQGYLYTVPGKGCFVADNNLENQIFHIKLKEFKGCVEDMMRHNIKEDDLKKAIDDVYAGGEKQ